MTRSTFYFLFCLLCCSSWMSFAGQPADVGPSVRSADTTAAAPAVSRGDDDWFDLSSFMDQPYGFLPMLEPVTEPAIGYGAWFGPMFISKPTGTEKPGWVTPNLTYVGGMWTETNSWGVLAMDLRQWMDKRLQTLFVVLYASLKLDFHGIGENALLKDNPIHYTLTPLLGMAKLKYRLGMSNFWVGAGYQYSTTTVNMDIPQERFPQVQDIRKDSDVGGVLASFTFDSRDNIFTPLSGTLGEISGTFFSKALGGDAAFQSYSATVLQYYSPDPTVTFGIRGDGLAAFGDAPFYMYPYVTLRGAAAMRYQGEQVAQVEFETRWQFWNRFSLIGFVGYGMAWNNFEYLENQINIWTYGTGLRYELARRYGLHFGVDVAWSPDDFAIYLQFGSAWMRP